MSQSKERGFAANFFAAFIANFTAMGIMAVLTLVLPRFLSAEDYGYWQLSIFYNIYAGYLTLGVAEGLYLRFGGHTYKSLPPRLISTHLIILQLMLAMLGSAAVFSVLLFGDGAERSFVLIVTAVSSFFYLSRSFLTTVFQAVGRIDVYAQSLLLERLLLLLGSAFVLLIGIREFEAFLLVDIVSKILGFIFTVYQARRVAYVGVLQVKNAISEVMFSVKAGIWVIFASTSAILITGVVRFSIEIGFGIVSFGLVALAFSIASMFQSVITSASMAVFPALKRIDPSSYQKLYLSVQRALSPFLLLLLLSYYPISLLLQWWLPAYSASVLFLAALFPIVIFETKSRVLFTPMLNALRRERLSTLINVVVLLIGVLTTWLTVVIFESVLWATISVTFLLAVRSVLLEFAVVSATGAQLSPYSIFDVVFSCFFIWVFCFSAQVINTFFFVALILCYIAFSSKRAIKAIKELSR